MSLVRKNFCGSHSSMASYVMKSVHESNQKEREEAERREDERVEKITNAILSKKEIESHTNNKGITININLPDSALSMSNSYQEKLERLIKEQIIGAISAANLESINESSNKKDYEA